MALPSAPLAGIQQSLAAGATPVPSPGKEWGEAASLDSARALVVAQAVSTAAKGLYRKESKLHGLVLVGRPDFPPPSPWKTPEELKAASAPLREYGGHARPSEVLTPQQNGSGW